MSYLLPGEESSQEKKIRKQWRIIVILAIVIVVLLLSLTITAQNVLVQMEEQTKMTAFRTGRSLLL